MMQLPYDDATLNGLLDWAYERPDSAERWGVAADYLLEEKHQPLLADLLGLGNNNSLLRRVEESHRLDTARKAFEAYWAGHDIRLQSWNEWLPLTGTYDFCPIGEEALRALQCGWLSKLQLRQAPPAAVLEQGVPRLVLSHNDGRDDPLATIARVPGLCSLRVYYSRVKDAELAHLADIPSLNSLTLDTCEQVTHAGLAHIGRLSSLTSLGITDTWSVMAQREGSVTDQWVGHVARLTGLHTLRLNDCDRFTDKGVAHLARLTSLRSLNLFKCKRVTDAGLAHLSSLSGLQSLNLGLCEQVTDAGLAHLSRLTSLRSLELAACEQITDAGLAHLAGLSFLRTLYLKECKQITDEGLAHLAGLSSLQYLNLDRCERLTDAGLTHLTRLTSLGALVLPYRWSAQVTDEAKDRLRQALPHCKIY